MTTTATRQIRLQSTPLINTPGLLRWAQNGYKFKKDRKRILNIFVQGYSGEGAPTKEEYHRLLMGEIVWTTDEENSVVFEV